jgi:hypothetical protein
VEVPAGLRGRLVLFFRPWWLVYGGGLSILCAIVFASGVVAAAVTGGRFLNSAAEDSGTYNAMET